MSSYVEFGDEVVLKVSEIVSLGKRKTNGSTPPEFHVDAVATNGRITTLTFDTPVKQGNAFKKVKEVLLSVK